jgi:hypothetical protein
VGGRTHSEAQGKVFSETIYAVNIATGKVSVFDSLPTAFGCHVSFLVDNRYLVTVGGTDGFEILPRILKYDI